MKALPRIIVLAALAAVAPATGANGDAPRVRGINLGGAALGAKELPGKHGTNYLWASAAEVALYAQAGFNALRIPFLWERIQPQLNGELDAAEAARLDEVVGAGAANGVTIILDIHNYGAYRQELVGTPNVPVAAFADLWSRIAARYKDKPHVAYGLMNEPNRQKAEEWAPMVQAAVDAIRASGAKQLILVPGTRWSGAHTWLAKDGRLSNAEALRTVRDPADNYVFEMHQYFDGNSSGTSPNCVSKQIGVERLKDVTAWLRANGRQALLGEFGASSDATCLKALQNTLDYMEKNADVWQGWTYWVAVKWMSNYMFNVYPPDPSRSPQMKVIDAFLPRTTKR